MPKVKYHFCPLEGRYASRDKSEFIYQDHRVVNTNSRIWIEFEVEENSEIDKKYRKMIISKKLADNLRSVIRLTRKQFMLYCSMKDKEPMTKKELFELNKSKVSKANIHRALTSEFKNAGISVVKTVEGSQKSYSITIPKQAVIEKDNHSTHIHLTSDRDLKIIKFRSQGETLECIGIRFNISKERVRQILKED